MFYPGTEVYKFVPHLIPYCCLKNNVVLGGTLRWLKGVQGAPRGSKMDLGGGPMFSPDLEVFRICITLDDLMTLLKSGGSRGHLKVV